MDRAKTIERFAMDRIISLEIMPGPESQISTSASIRASAALLRGVLAANACL